MSLLSSWRGLFGLPELPAGTIQEGDDTFGTAYVEDAVLRHHIEQRNASLLSLLGDTGRDYVEQTLRHRAAAYAAHLNTMPPASEMTLWAVQMASTYSPYVKVHHLIHDNWLTALLVIRYGEEPDAAKTADGTGWPLEFSDADRDRAAKLLAGKDWPEFVTIVPRYIP